MKYPVGTRVRVVDCYSGGNFQVGDIVHIDHIGFEDDLDCYGAISPHDNRIWYLREDEVELVEENPPCYLPEKDNPYPLCVGRGMKACTHCTLWTDYDPGKDESRVNRPLTRSQMREMNGQPVWCKEMGLISLELTTATSSRSPTYPISKRKRYELFWGHILMLRIPRYDFRVLSAQ